MSELPECRLCGEEPVAEKKHDGINVAYCDCLDCKLYGIEFTPGEWRGLMDRPEGEVVVTRVESGSIVAVTRQDNEGRMLSVIAE